MLRSRGINLHIKAVNRLLFLRTVIRYVADFCNKIMVKLCKSATSDWTLEKQPTPRFAPAGSPLAQSHDFLLPNDSKK